MSYPFEPRRWQGQFVRDYQTKGKKNYLLEACTAAGKTGAAIYAYVSLKISFGWDFFTGVVPSDTLMKQYAQDAQNLFGLKFYYSGTDKRLGRIPTINELISKGYDGLIVSYQWLSYGENARTLRQSIENSSANKIFLVLDEVHHVSDELSYGQACEVAFPDEIISHRLMTSGTPFRSDGKRILGGWIDYQHDETKNQYIYKPNFGYKLVNALDDGIIPHFSFVTLGGEFSYRDGEAIYEGKRFETEENEENLPKLLNTAILVDGVWVETAIEWAHQRMKRDRQNGFPECATYVRVPKIETTYKMQKRIYEITNQEALVVVSQDDPSFSSNFRQQGDPSQLIENFAAETGHSATSWIIGVGMLGEGISIKRLKYRIHATNICARLSFEQDLVGTFITQISRR